MLLLVDLNLVLDVLLQREPHVEASAALWREIELGHARGLLAAHCVTTLHYLAGRTRDRVFADRCVAEVLSVFGVAPVTDGVLQHAVSLGWSDFEDAVCTAAAAASGCQAIVTRDRRGFRDAPVSVMTPAEALGAIRTAPRP